MPAGLVSSKSSLLCGRWPSLGEEREGTLVSLPMRTQIQSDQGPTLMTLEASTANAAVGGYSLNV